MASDYGYTTLAKLEKYAIIDYSSLDSALTDAAVEAKISDAERFINGYIGTIFTGTIPADIELVTNMIAKTMLDNWLIEKGIGGFSQYAPVVTPILGNLDIVNILEKYREEYQQSQKVFISKRVHTGTYILKENPLGWS